MKMRKNSVIILGCALALTFILGGNTRFSLLGNVAAYVAALAITPLICTIS